MPEMQNIEWKAKWKDDYLEWICGFANAQSGKIYIDAMMTGKLSDYPIPANFSKISPIKSAMQ